MRRPKQRPRMSEQEAGALADELVARELGTVPPCDGGSYEGAPSVSLAFSYRIETEAGAVVDPSHLIVIVDVDTRTASYFPTM